MLKCFSFSEVYTVNAKASREVDVGSKLPRVREYVAGWTSIRVQNPSLYEATLSFFGDITKLNIDNNSAAVNDITVVVYVLYK